MSRGKSSHRTFAGEGSLVIIRGPPGVGKTTIGKLLWKRYGDGAIIEAASLRNMQTNTKWEDLQSYRLALKQTAIVAREFLDEGRRPVIIVDALPGWALTYLLRNLREPCLIVTLMATPSALLKRVRGRIAGYSDESAILGVRKEMKEDASKGVVLDTSKMNASQVASKVFQLIG